MDQQGGRNNASNDAADRKKCRSDIVNKEDLALTIAHHKRDTINAKAKSWVRSSILLGTEGGVRAPSSLLNSV